MSQVSGPVEKSTNSQLPRNTQPSSSRYLLLGLAVGLMFVVALEGFLRWLDVGDPPAFRDDPSYGYQMQPTQSVSPRGYRFYINGNGFRGKDILMPKPPGIYRIAFLGDSITYGGGRIHDEDLFVNKVASLLSKDQKRIVESVNLSVPGWGIQNIAAYVSSMGVFQADLVVWVIPSCDFQRPKTTASEMGDPETRTKFRLAYIAQTAWWTLKSFVRVLPSQASHENDSQVLAQNLQAVQQTTTQLKSKSVQVVIVTVPYESGYKPSADLERFSAAAARSLAPFFDSAHTLLRQGSDRLFIDGVHLNARGHQQLAEAIVRFLKTSFFASE